jgi:hypothetical protein
MSPLEPIPHLCTCENLYFLPIYLVGEIAFQLLIFSLSSFTSDFDEEKENVDHRREAKTYWHNNQLWFIMYGTYMYFVYMFVVGRFDYLDFAHRGKKSRNKNNCHSKIVC